MDPDALREGLKRLGVPHDRVAEAIGRDRTAATKLIGGKRSIKAQEIKPLTDLIAEYEEEAGEAEVITNGTRGVERVNEGVLEDYCEVEMLPTFAGAGGGGTGEGARRVALVPRRIVEGQLRARPEDLLIVEVRGTSMEPDFYNGDRVLIDRRDRDTRQGGPFALFDGDAYILKNVEQLPGVDGKLRVFSSNRLFSDWFPAPGEAHIEGRPVWFARRL